MTMTNKPYDKAGVVAAMRLMGPEVVAVGSAVLVLHDLAETARDIDLLVSQSVWDHCAANAWRKRSISRSDGLSDDLPPLEWLELAGVELYREVNLPGLPRDYSWEGARARAEAHDASRGLDGAIVLSLSPLDLLLWYLERDRPKDGGKVKPLVRYLAKTAMT
jgi:hypothetical protein